MERYQIVLTLLFLSFLLATYKTKAVGGQEDSGVAVDHFPDQREHLKALKDDIITVKCEDYDFSTVPVGIRNRFFILLRGWIYTDRVLSHIIAGEGLAEGILVQNSPNYEFLKEYGGYYVSDKPYIKAKLYHTEDAVWFMNKRYPTARESGDSIFSSLIRSENGRNQSVWIFVGNIPLKSN